MHLTPLEFTFVAFLVSILAGLFGALLGLGGGVIVIPALTLLLKVDMRFAIGASIVAVIATSSGSAASYVRERLSNLRIGMLLEMFTTTGAVCGAWLSGLFPVKCLYLIFAGVLAFTAVAMFLKKREVASDRPGAGCRLADRLQLHGDFYDQGRGQRIAYRVSRTPIGLAMSWLAGNLSGLLGIGGGILKVPAMNLGMRMPLKVSTATSNFTIGVTAAAGAGVHFARGNIDPFVAAPVAAGVVIGARIGSHLLSRIQSRYLRIVFIFVLLYTAAQMVLKGMKG